MKYDPALRLPKARNPAWAEQLFSSQTALSGGIVRRKKRDVLREIGLDAFLAEVTRRRFHMIECGGQFIFICNPGQIRIHC